GDRTGPAARFYRAARSHGDRLRRRLVRPRLLGRRDSRLRAPSLRGRHPAAARAGGAGVHAPAARGRGGLRRPHAVRPAADLRPCRDRPLCRPGARHGHADHAVGPLLSPAELAARDRAGVLPGRRDHGAVQVTGRRSDAAVPGLAMIESLQQVAYGLTLAATPENLLYALIGTVLGKA